MQAGVPSWEQRATDKAAVECHTQAATLAGSILAGNILLIKMVMQQHDRFPNGNNSLSLRGLSARMSRHAKQPPGRPFC